MNCKDTFTISNTSFPIIRSGKNLCTVKGDRRGNWLLIIIISFFLDRVPAQNWDKSSKISGYEAIQKAEKEKRASEQKTKSSYGAWGSTFKNKDHFASLHHC
ncbi:hypothetical protein QE152_g25306 [Popillia japonica]|uniref:Uncharacterized protein n=1 Tax=Popillia japonica TaxID=7064 RepID=A0AAW1K139_POPJA